MQITDGTTTLTYDDSEEILNDFDIEKATKRTAGGDLRSITAGERFNCKERFRTTAAGARSLVNLLNNGATDYWFTPTVDWSTDLYTNITFPLNVNITNMKIEWHNRTTYYITLGIESTSYV